MLVFTAVLVALSFPAGAYAMYSGRLSDNVTSASLMHPYFWIGPVPLVLGALVPAGAVFGAFTAVYAAMLLYGGYQRRRPWRAVIDSAKEGPGALMSSPLVAMLVSMGFLVFAASMVDELTASAGVPIGNIAGDPLVLLLGFTVAPFVEELGFRVVLIGVVALALSAGRPLRDALGALWRPSKATEGLAGRSGASVAIWAAVAVSSLVFGWAHIASGSGWQIGKLPEAAFGGVVLGYVYVKYGFHVAVITHWGVDYFGSAFSFYGQAAYGIPWASNTAAYIGQDLVNFDMLYLFGLASFLLVLYLGVMRLAESKSRGAEPFIPAAEGGGVQQ